jgi:cystathionine beta-synthase
MDGEHIVGILEESDLLLKLDDDASQFKTLVADTMTQKIETLAPNDSLATLHLTLNKGFVAIIVERGHFYGFITRFDLLNHLRRSLVK